MACEISRISGTSAFGKPCEISQTPQKLLQKFANSAKTLAKFGTLLKNPCKIWHTPQKPLQTSQNPLQNFANLVKPLAKLRKPCKISQTLQNGLQKLGETPQIIAPMLKTHLELHGIGLSRDIDGIGDDGDFAEDGKLIIR
jgi:hypothetical protein